MVHSVDVLVGKRVRHRRWLQDMSQTELGDKVGIKFQQIQKYETGANRISASRLWDIANALHVPVSYFFEGVELPSNTNSDASYPADIMTDKEAVRFIRLYYALPAPLQKQLFDLAQVLAA